MKEELKKILPQLEEMRKRKSERRNQFLDALEEIRNISNEIQGSIGYIPSTTVDETDLSLRKLEELHRQLQALQKEKVKLFFNLNPFLLCMWSFVRALYLCISFSCFADGSTEAGSGSSVHIKLTLLSSWYGFQADYW